jgi:GAF domain-containing protein
MSERMLSQLRDPAVFAQFNETVLAAHAELNLDAALRQIVELARDLAGARYAALGIVGTDGFLTDFVTTGLSDAERATIGPLPRGHGILGVPIRLGEEAVGNLYLTEKQGADEFSAEDQQLVELLAQHAAVAVLNARRFTDSEHQRQLLSAILDHIPDGVTIREAPSGKLLATNDRARELLGIVT